VRLDGFFAVNHLYDIMAVTRDDAYLIDLPGVLLGFHLDRQHRGFDDAALQASLPTTHRLHSVNQDVAPLRLVLVLGESWPSGELGGVLFVGCSRLEKGCPILVQEHQHLLTDLRRQCFVGFMRLHALVHLAVVEVLALMNKGLPHLVQRRIVQVFRLESRFINHAVAWVTFPDAMLFNELHGVSPLCMSLLLRLLQNGHLLDLQRGLLVRLFLLGERELLLPVSVSVSHTYCLVF
jgi:hypothetical protein